MAPATEDWQRAREWCCLHLSIWSVEIVEHKHISSIQLQPKFSGFGSLCLHGCFLVTFVSQSYLHSETHRKSVLVGFGQTRDLRSVLDPARHTIGGVDLNKPHQRARQWVKRVSQWLLPGSDELTFPAQLCPQTLDFRCLQGDAWLSRCTKPRGVQLLSCVMLSRPKAQPAALLASPCSPFCLLPLLPAQSNQFSIWQKWKREKAGFSYHLWGRFILWLWTSHSTILIFVLLKPK